MRAGPAVERKKCTRFAIGLIQQLPHLSNLLLWLIRVDLLVHVVLALLQTLKFFPNYLHL